MDDDSSKQQKQVMQLPDPRPQANPEEASPQLAETRISGESVYEGRLLKVYKDWVRAPDGHEQFFEYTLHPGAAAIVPVLDNGKLLLERQWRYALNRSFLEFPAGKLNPGEDPLLTAQRELQEETGYTASHWEKLGVMHPVIGYSTEVIHLFIARGLKEGPHAREEGECLELLQVSVDEFFELVWAGEITDSKTIACSIHMCRTKKNGLNISPFLHPDLRGEAP